MGVPQPAPAGKWWAAAPPSGTAAGGRRPDGLPVGAGIAGVEAAVGRRATASAAVRRSVRHDCMHSRSVLRASRHSSLDVASAQAVRADSISVGHAASAQATAASSASSAQLRPASRHAARQGKSSRSVIAPAGPPRPPGPPGPPKRPKPPGPRPWTVAVAARMAALRVAAARYTFAMGIPPLLWG